MTRGAADGTAPTTPVDDRAGEPFELDRFQLEAIAAIERDQSVLVAAPTGSGKTVAAEHAVDRALASGRRAFYTTPIKALSNQKFHDLVMRLGPASVGLLTGDNAINGDAPVLVMTTEVLRNMIYARSRGLDDLGWVVLDEVHYLQDEYRGPVWEEVIIHLPREVRLVCLSATVSNAAEVAEWIETVRGPTALVVETDRPVELDNLFLVGDTSSEQPLLIPTLVDGRPNPEGDRFDTVARVPGRGRPRRRWFAPRRVDVIELLRERELLPAIYFIFSRAACDDAVSGCLDAGLRLIDSDERARVHEIVDRHLAPLSDDDLDVLGYDRWIAGLDAGIAAHHAGMVPPFKEAVERCFVEGLVRAVFATETLALGINMPARTVVIEKLTKFTGERHEFLSPGQYTQLTGRAGRRGIDTAGTAVVLWSPFVSFGEVAGLAASRSFVLRSAFRPTYNMAANLVRRYPADTAHHLLNLSFAQYQADRAVVQLETRLDRREQVLAELRSEATCSRGDLAAYRARVGDDLPEAPSTKPDLDDALGRLRPGDVVRLVGGSSAGKVAVLTVARRRGGAVRLRVITPQRRILNLGSHDFRRRPEVIGRVTLPTPFAPHNRGFQREVSAALNRVDERGADGTRRAAKNDGMARVSREAVVDDDPVASCPDLDRHLRAARRAERVGREVDDLKRQVLGRTESLARRFDRVLQVLEARGHLDGWALTPKGERLVRIFHESDLLVAEALDAGLLDDADPATLAGLASCFTYEHRSPLPPAPAWYPSPAVRRRVATLEQLAAGLAADEEEVGLPLTRPPDSGFFALAYAWTAGEPLDEVLEDEELSGGDFVRNAKLLIDLLGQVADAAPSPETARTAREAADRIFRGVVAASSVTSPDPDEP
jgi:ATP-dependent RNA helicase HelY